jgi:hypothetical protein
MGTRIGSTSFILVAVAAALSAPPAAVAITKCSAKTGGTDGVIAVSASPVAGPLRWGDRADAIASAFANDPTCVANGKAKGCELGPTSPVISREAITPPDLCTIYVDDGTGPCAAYVKGCTPGARGAFGHPNGGGLASPRARDCFTGEVYLSAGRVAGGMPAAGQILPIGQFTALYSLIENRFGGDLNQSTFALPDLRGQAPDGLTYVICVEGIFPPSFPP